MNGSVPPAEIIGDKDYIFGFLFPVRNGETENKGTNISRVYFVMLIEGILALEV